MLRFIILAMGIACGSLAWSQNAIKGKVADAISGEGLPGANILIKETAIGALSGADGSFSLEVPDGAKTLIVSLNSYATQEVSLTGQSELEISLYPSNYNLDEVLITALGIKQDRKALGYSAERIDSRQITQVRETNLITSFAGRVAGVQTSGGASGPGASSRIVIRGETSLSGSNQPLFVIDGVPVSNELIANNTPGIESGFQEVDYGNGAAEINPDDIASITILKGPGAAALYGSRAAKGVVVIETKDGSDVAGIGVSINSSVTFETPLTMPQYQNRYGQGAAGQFAFEDGIDAGINDGGLVSFGPALDGQLITQFDGPSTDVDGNPVRGGDVIARDGNPITPTAWNPNPDNVRSFFQTGVTFINNIALNAGNDNSSLRLSYTNLENSGIIPNSDLHRNSLSLSGKADLTSRLSTRAYVNFINSKADHRPSLGYGSENPMYSFTWMGRQVDVSAAENYWQAGQEGFQQFNYNYLWLDNPYFAVNENTNGFDKDRLLGNASVRYRFSDRLDLRVRAGMDNYDDLRQSRRAFSTQRWRNGAYREDEVSFTELNTDALLSYTPELNEDMSLTVSLGGNIMNQDIAYKSTIAGELSVPGIYNFENSRIPLVVTQQNSEKRIYSTYANGRWGYQSRLFLDLNLRNDWSSTLPAGSNSYLYYSANAAAILSDFVKMPRFIDYAKLRLSAASVGNDTDPFQLRNTFAYNANYSSFPLMTNASGFLNPDLRPERLNALEAGLELWFLKGRLALDVSGFRNMSTDQIVNLPTSAASGFESRRINGGKIKSQGLEVSLRARPIQKKDFSWSLFSNFYRNVSSVEELPEGVDQYVTGFAAVYSSTANTVFYIANPGEGRMGDMYGTGFVKVDGQVLHDNNGLPVRDPELRKLGNYNPDFIVGFGNEFRYKNLRLSFVLDWRQGGTIVSRMLAIGSTSGVLEHTLEGRETGIVGEGVMNIGTESEPEYVPNTTSVPASTYYNQFYNRANEESSVYDASYLKLRQISLGYSLPQRWLEKVGLQEVELSFIGSNLFLLTENPHFDPDLSAMQGRNFAYGVEDMAYPSSRSYGFSVKVKL